MRISDHLEGVKTISIFGHVRPDGDCIGSTLALTHYLKENYPDIDTKVFLEGFSSHFNIIPGTELVEKHFYNGQDTDLCIILDVSAIDRVGAGGGECLKNARRSLCIDHHIKSGYELCGTNIIESDFGSASELLMTLMDKDKISRNTAICLYLGIAHDTGVFQFSATTPDTLKRVAFLLEKDIPFSDIIQNTYYCRTYNQVRATGAVMTGSKTAFDGKVIYGYLTYDDMKTYKVNSLEMDGIVDALREYDECDVAIFMYPLRDSYKLSLRSKKIVDVNKVCNAFGGGGHVRAAGCQQKGDPEAIIKNVLEEIGKQL